ncbi:MAG: esterase-like activity of phytase family protein [Pseudomonadota bacterium]
MLWRFSVALILAAGAALSQPLTHIRTIPLGAAAPGFGGLSAIEIRAPGRALVLSDRGQAFDLVIDRHAGTVTATATGQPRPNRDSEGLAWAGDTLYFSYEGPAQVVRADGTALPGHPDFARLHPNRSFDALAAAPDGTVYTLPERPSGANAPFPIYAFTGGEWRVAGTLPRAGAFLVAGADMGPDGLLYILERAFSPLGFRTRIRRFDPGTPDAPAPVLLKTGIGAHDNLEGIALWQSASGATCLTMVSDDNFLSIQRSELVEYALTETLAGGATCD